MATGRVWKRLLGWGDLIGVALLGVWTVLQAHLSIVGPPLSVGLGALAVLVAPGYAAAVGLFPRRRTELHQPGQQSGNPIEDHRTTSFERAGLGLGLSVCIVSLVGLGMHFSVWGVQSVAFLTAVGLVTLFLSGVAVLSRLGVPPRDRWYPRPLSVLSALGELKTTRRTSPLTVSDGAASGGQRLVTAALILGLVLAGSGLGFALVTVDNGERYTELYLLSEDPETGELVAGNYPSKVPRGGEATVVVGVENRERQRMNYTVISLLQRFDETGRLVGQQRLGEVTTTVPHNESDRFQLQIQPELSGTELRVTVLLYKDPPPEGAVTADTAYRQVHFWIEPSSNGADTAA